MPLQQSGSKAAFQKNVAAEMAAGKPAKQATAIAYSVQRANDDSVVTCTPENVTPATINEENRKYWEKK